MNLAIHIKRTVTCLIMVFLISVLRGQTQLDFEKTMDSLFGEWNTNDAPGMAVGILQNGKPRYLNGFGIANLETKSPITTETRFQIDELSKQFTVLAFLLLAEQGKISMDDDIRTYIPRLPEYAQPIRLKHVLNHCTGLWDYSLTRSLIGAKPGDVFTHEQALALIASQRQLGFTPGTRFSTRTSDTEMTLMAEIIAKASGQTLPEFASDFIFAPLRMNNTLFSDDHEAILTNLAESYQATDTGFKKRVLNTSNVGASNLYTSAQDLAIWYSQYSRPKSGLAATIQKLHEFVVLDDGSNRKDSWGILTLARDFWHKERGIPAYWQFGLLGGYGVNMFGFPQQDVYSFVLGNNDQYNGMYAMMAVEPLLKGAYKAPLVVDFNKKGIKKLSAGQLAKFEGDYWDAEGGYARRVFVKNDTLRYHRLESGFESALVPLSETRFQMVVDSDDVVIFEFKKEGEAWQLWVTPGESTPYVYKPYEPMTYDDTDLLEFTGTFYNDELDTVYRFSVVDGNLSASHLKNGTVVFQPIMNDIFWGDRPFFNCLSFIRKGGRITAFELVVDGIENLRFLKVPVPSS